MTGSIEAGRAGGGRPSQPPSQPSSQRSDPSADEARLASRTWWDAEAAGYQAEHGDFLGDARFVWGPEGLDEATAGLLGPTEELAGLRVLEVGAGAGQCSRWLLGVGARPTALDLSFGQLQEAADADARTGARVAAVQADAEALPFGRGAFDLAVSAYGALPFVPDLAAVHREVARVLRPGGRWVFSVPHPVRWAFPDVPGPAGLTAVTPYFDRSPYVERDDEGRVGYVEYHRTLGDHVRAVVDAGLRLVDLVEPEWPPENDRVWGGWSPLRGRLLPGTAILVTVRD